MRPALQKLLLRPSSLELLRCLVDTPGVILLTHAPAARNRQAQGSGTSRARGYADVRPGPRHQEVYDSAISHDGRKMGTPESVLLRSPSTKIRQCLCRGTRRTRDYASTAEAALNEAVYGSRSSHGDRDSRTQEPPKDIDTYNPCQTPDPAPSETILGNTALADGYYGQWKKRSIWTVDEIDFESNLAAPENPQRQRLIDRREHKMDLQLFARLLDHRERRYGMEGVRMFWEAVKKRRIRLPTRDYRESKNKGLPAEKFWTSFLRLGFYDNKILEELCTYADELLETEQRRWPRLYSMVVQHFLLRGQGIEAVAWHNRLLERHPPSATSFAELCRQTVHHKGDLNALKEIYDKNEHRNAYGRIVPTLCRQEDFKSAMEWHFRLIANRDVPLKAQHAQALTRFLAIYDPPNAVRVTKSLVAAGAPFQVSSALNDNVKISREIMNLVHGATFKIPVKAYNDELGARWFATTWVPLDLTMHSVHALGIQEIGPLSLQALCLRSEPDGSEPRIYTITRRIEQLQSIGISIGNSVFSRAVKHFAQNRMFSHLMGLLKSDQHPDALEDWKTLEELLAFFAQTKDWDQYRRILAIRTLGSKSPATEAQNVWLRAHITNRDLPAALETLEKMQVNGTIVKMTTISYILRAVLIPRGRGRKTLPGSRDLYMATTILKGIMDAGNLVPAVYWREIVRRFGMMRPNSDLRNLCIFLATRYGPTDKTYLAHIGTRRANIHRVPSQVDPSHPLHPLKILFPVSLQRTIVEWGFIHAFKHAERKKPAAIQGKSFKRLGPEININCQVTAGISLLKELGQLGVHIDERAIRKAIFHRLIIYYGPGRSNKLYNRVARPYVPEFGAMIRFIDDAMGRQTFGSDVRLQIKSRGVVKLLGRARKAKTREMKRLKSRVFANNRLLL
jgi:hypothetical protein